MNALDRFDRDFEAWFASEASTIPPDGLLARVIARPRPTRQHARWLAVTRAGGFSAQPESVSPRARWIAYVAVILGLILALVLAGIAASPRPKPPTRPSDATARLHMRSISLTPLGPVICIS